MVPPDAAGTSKKLPDSLVQPTEAGSYLGAMYESQSAHHFNQETEGRDIKWVGSAYLSKYDHPLVDIRYIRIAVISTYVLPSLSLQRWEVVAIAARILALPRLNDV